MEIILSSALFSDTMLWPNSVLMSITKARTALGKNISWDPFICLVCHGPKHLCVDQGYSAIIFISSIFHSFIFISTVRFFLLDIIPKSKYGLNCWVIIFFKAYIWFNFRQFAKDFKIMISKSNNLSFAPVGMVNF